MLIGTSKLYHHNDEEAAIKLFNQQQLIHQMQDLTARRRRSSSKSRSRSSRRGASRKSSHCRHVDNEGLARSCNELSSKRTRRSNNGKGNVRVAKESYSPPFNDSLPLPPLNGMPLESQYQQKSESLRLQRNVDGGDTDGVCGDRSQVMDEGLTRAYSDIHPSQTGANAMSQSEPLTYNKDSYSMLKNLSMEVRRAGRYGNDDDVNMSMSHENETDKSERDMLHQVNAVSLQKKNDNTDIRKRSRGVVESGTDFLSRSLRSFQESESLFKSLNQIIEKEHKLQRSPSSSGRSRESSKNSFSSPGRNRHLSTEALNQLVIRAFQDLTLDAAASKREREVNRKVKAALDAADNLPRPDVAQGLSRSLQLIDQAENTKKRAGHQVGEEIEGFDTRTSHTSFNFPSPLQGQRARSLTKKLPSRNVGLNNDEGEVPNPKNCLGEHDVAGASIDGDPLGKTEATDLTAAAAVAAQSTKGQLTCDIYRSFGGKKRYEGETCNSTDGETNESLLQMNISERTTLRSSCSLESLLGHAQVPIDSSCTVKEKRTEPNERGEQDILNIALSHQGLEQHLSLKRIQSPTKVQDPNQGLGLHERSKRKDGIAAKPKENDACSNDVPTAIELNAADECSIDVPSVIEFMSCETLPSPPETPNQRKESELRPSPLPGSDLSPKKQTTKPPPPPPPPYRRNCSFYSHASLQEGKRQRAIGSIGGNEMRKSCSSIKFNIKQYPPPPRKPSSAGPKSPASKIGDSSRASSTKSVGCIAPTSTSTPPTFLIRKSSSGNASAVSTPPPPPPRQRPGSVASKKGDERHGRRRRQTRPGNAGHQEKMI